MNLNFILPLGRLSRSKGEPALSLSDSDLWAESQRRVTARDMVLSPRRISKKEIE